MLNIGLIGEGRIARVHARSVAQNPATQLVLVGDVLAATGDELASLQSARSTDHIDSVFTDPHVDAVIICSSAPRHVDHVVAAACAGKRHCARSP